MHLKPSHQLASDALFDLDECLDLRVNLNSVRLGSPSSARVYSTLTAFYAP